MTTTEEIAHMERRLIYLKSKKIKEDRLNLSPTGLGYYNGVPILPITLPKR